MKNIYVIGNIKYASYMEDGNREISFITYPEYVYLGMEVEHDSRKFIVSSIVDVTTDDEAQEGVSYVKVSAAQK